MQSNKTSNIPPFIVAALLWSLAVMMFARDIQKIWAQKSEIPEAARVSAAAIRTVSDPKSGWYPAQLDPVFGFETDAQGWKLDSDAATPPPLAISDQTASEGKHALALPVHFPDPATITRDNTIVNDPYRLQGVRYIAYDVFVPKNCSGYVGALLFMKDKDGLWYQARSRAALIPGKWTTVTADIRGDSPDVIPLGHLGQWDENQAARVNGIGITVYGEREYSGTVLIDNIRGWMRAPRFVALLNQLQAQPVSPDRAKTLFALKQQAEAFPTEPIRIINLRTDPPAPPKLPPAPSAASQPSMVETLPSVQRFDTMTLRFELSRQADNPFDPEKADIICKVVAPSGKVSENIGFWSQDYDRVDRFAGDDLKAIGRPEWRVRITPAEVGVYTCTVSARLGADSVSSMPLKFRSVPSDAPGFIRVSKKDPRYFETDTGDFYYPVGHNLHSPIDIRCWKEVIKLDPPAGRGLNMYADFFNKMQNAGENTAEVWMSSWWVGIEWTSQWRDYFGHGRYSLQNAWKLDTLLEMARKHGIRIHLVLDNHGKFSEYCDWEWELNPYNSVTDGGGVVRTAQEFFTNETARKWHRNKLRYIVARWGADPTILGWELVSEYDLVGGNNRNDMGARNTFHRSPTLQAWAREMINYIRACDPQKHPVTVHYASDFKFVDLGLATTPAFDYVVTDAYRPDAGYTGAATRMENWASATLLKPGTPKPFWITEYGGDWNATAPSALEADLVCGPWATWMTEGAGTPMLWWYDFIDRNDLYGYLHGFSNYIKGEDRRGLEGACADLPVSGGNADGTLASRAFIWKTGAYAWVYDEPSMRSMPLPDQRRKHTAVEIPVPGLDLGNYTLEFWDCTAGTIVKTEPIKIDETRTTIMHFPDFVTNMAIKIKPAK